MGGLLSYLFAAKPNAPISAEFIKDDPGLDQLDSKTGLTAREKKVIQETWALVEKDIRGNGVDFFIAFFKSYPPYQKYFKSFADVPFGELKENRKLHAHAYSVMYAIASMVNNLDDIDCLAEILTKTGHNHGGRNIKIEHFENLAVVFTDFLGERLGDILTPFARSAWTKALGVINSVIKPALEANTTGQSSLVTIPTILTYQQIEVSGDIGRRDGQQHLGPQHTQHIHNQQQ